MFYIIQSNDTDTLVNHLIDFYKDLSIDGELSRAIFDPFTVIVPSMVLGDWLTKQVALKLGVSTLFTAQFWGKYQWQMTQTVLEKDAQTHPYDSLVVPEVAVLSASIMRWRIFSFVSAQLQQLTHIIDDTEHPLHLLIKPLYDEKTGVAEHRLWQACDELSSVYVRYLTHRPQWLLSWSKGESLADDVKKMMSDKARLEREFGAIRPSEHTDDMMYELPEWLQEHYLALERLLRFLWHSLFAQTYLYRTALEERFWQVLSGERGDELASQAKQALPKRLYLFTVQQIPQVELDFLKQLSQYLDVILCHFNPSMMFWADIVDKNWLLTQRIIKPNSVYLKDYGHGLLSRLGKESRETFAMLADMTGGADDGDWVINWQEQFVRHYDKNPTLLNALKQDILMLGDGDVDSQNELGWQMLQLLQNDEMLATKTRPKVGMPIQPDNSLSIHVCHSLKRQLEIARLMIAQYLNDNPKRTLADVVVLLPDVDSTQELILSVFPNGVGIDGLTLPIKITGTTDKNIDELLYAIMGFYELVGEPSSRFYADDVYEWLQTPALYQSFGLGFDEIKRGCELLAQAGFKRGFDERHLAQTLDKNDDDYRYTFSYALDRIVMGLLAPTDGLPNASLYPFVWRDGVFAEAVLPLVGVSLSDEKIINALTAIHAGLHDNRHAYQQTDDVEKLLEQIERDVIHRFFGVFHQSIAMRAIFNAKNAMKASLRANKVHHPNQKSQPVMLSLKFVLNSLVNDVKAQALSAEPAEVITFARFGSLRSIPFGLTVMLDMNVSSFPRQDKKGRLDLMRAGINQRGDRYNEDDDNGAFLDALLCTKDRVLIFYHGMSADGKTQLLPASVVSELLQFFKTDALWQDDDLSGSDDEMSLMVRDIGQAMPALIERHLITHHEAHAFDRQVFYHEADDDDPKDVLDALRQRIDSFKQIQKQQLPPPMIWQQVRHVLDGHHDDTQTVSLLSTDELHHIQDILQAVMSYQITDKTLADFEQMFDVVTDGDVFYESGIDELVFAITRPARAFLSRKIAFAHLDDDLTLDEPLVLDGLDNYRIKNIILNDIKAGIFDDVSLFDGHLSQKLHAMQYGDILPAGVPRWTVLSEHLNDFGQKMTQFVATMTKIDDDQLHHRLTNCVTQDKYSSYFTKTQPTQVSFGVADKQIIINANLPKPDESLWVDFVPRTARVVQLVRFWLYHLLWQIEGGEKVSIWQFDRASDDGGFDKQSTFMLANISADEAKRYLLGFIVLAKIIKQKPIVMTCRESMNHAKKDNNKSPSINKWLNYPNHGMVDDENSHHETWQFILKNQDPSEQLLNTLAMTDILFKPINHHLKNLS
ncbi:exodeoxyribonuclease V subunit gamma [Moraxella sp. VT-16-12]|uniref:exodeoxyribonuclease V subunit gamma n=1 Tax=Moraxella sp. VT-16-12 TaxID=2014877 RepID=UPI000B7FD262|nr:exodeoxyribonuclease V subunit gamma [Moraxella sp. VT-16-12]TWV80664.1 exonuclease V subunit gamma [Moraxella sp. VT-16-12]